MPKTMNDDDYRKKYEGKLPGGKWVSSPDEHAEHDGQSLVTRNHDVIKRWAEERDAIPATVGGTEHEGRPGVLRFDFPGGSRDLQEVGWDDWFRSFDERDLVFLYQENLKSGKQSNFFKLNNPEREDDDERERRESRERRRKAA
jgi:hypothetical protein